MAAQHAIFFCAYCFEVQPSFNKTTPRTYYACYFRYLFALPQKSTTTQSLPLPSLTMTLPKRQAAAQASHPPTQPPTHIAAQPDTFFAFLRHPDRRTDLLLLVAIHLLAFLFVAYTYPSPYTNADTGSYLACSVSGKIDGYRPIGYSWFLSAFRAISASTFFVFAAQFWLHALANSFFLLTLQYFVRPVRRILFGAAAILLLISPATLFLTNALLSDSIFSTLSLVWLTSGMWLWRRFSLPMLLLHLLVMYWAVNVRYAGLFYPVFSALLLALQNGKQRYYLPVLPLLIGVYIYVATKAEMRQRFGVDTFSAFSGWAQANNATAVIPYIDLQPDAIASEALRNIHQQVLSEPKEMYNTHNVMGTMFIWGKERAGKKALFDYWQKNQGSDYTRAWVRVGMQMGNYAQLLRQHYPWLYVRHFILPNAANIIVPRYDFLSYRNVAQTDEIVQQLYGDRSFEARHDWIATYIATLCRPANVLLWLLCAAAIGIVASRYKQYAPSQPHAAPIAAYLLLFIGIYAIFSAIAHPFYLRYALPLHAPQIALLYLAAQYLYKIKAVK